VPILAKRRNEKLAVLTATEVRVGSAKEGQETFSPSPFTSKEREKSFRVGKGAL
jgi:hypothetical protein